MGGGASRFRRRGAGPPRLEGAARAGRGAAGRAGGRRGLSPPQPSPLTNKPRPPTPAQTLTQGDALREVSPEEGAAFARDYGCLYKETSAKVGLGGGGVGWGRESGRRNGAREGPPAAAGSSRARGRRRATFPAPSLAPNSPSPHHPPATTTPQKTDRHRRHRRGGLRCPGVGHGVHNPGRPPRAAAARAVARRRRRARRRRAAAAAGAARRRRDGLLLSERPALAAAGRRPRPLAGCCARPPARPPATRGHSPHCTLGPPETNPNQRRTSASKGARRPPPRRAASLAPAPRPRPRSARPARPGGAPATGRRATSPAARRRPPRPPRRPPPPACRRRGPRRARPRRPRARAAPSACKPTPSARLFRCGGVPGVGVRAGGAAPSTRPPGHRWRRRGPRPPPPAPALPLPPPPPRRGRRRRGSRRAKGAARGLPKPLGARPRGAGGARVWPGGGGGPRLGRPPPCYRAVDTCRAHTESVETDPARTDAPRHQIGPPPRAPHPPATPIAALPGATPPAMALRCTAAAPTAAAGRRGVVCRAAAPAPTAGRRAALAAGLLGAAGALLPRPAAALIPDEEGERRARARAARLAPPARARSGRGLGGRQRAVARGARWRACCVRLPRDSAARPAARLRGALHRLTARPTPHPPKPPPPR
jgi:hypothetical protein